MSHDFFSGIIVGITSASLWALVATIPYARKSLGPRIVLSSLIAATTYSVVCGLLIGLVQGIPFLVKDNVKIYTLMSLSVALSSSIIMFLCIYFIHWFQPSWSTLRYLKPYLNIIYRPLLGITSVYLICTLFFSIWYWAIWTWDNNAIRGPTDSLNLYDFFYFSLVTIATLGYGDILPNSPLTKSLVIIEVICGIGFATVGIAVVLAYVQPRFSRLSEQQNMESNSSEE